MASLMTNVISEMRSGLDSLRTAMRSEIRPKMVGLHSYIGDMFHHAYPFVVFPPFASSTEIDLKLPPHANMPSSNQRQDPEITFTAVELGFDS